MSQPPRRIIIPVHVAAPAPCCDHGHDHTHAEDEPLPKVDSCCGPATLAQQPPQPAQLSAPPPDAARVRYRIDNMDCPTEERLIRHRLEPMHGVLRLDFNLLARELTVYHRLEDTQGLASALSELDMAPRELEAGQRPAALPPALAPRLKALLAVSGLAALGAEALEWLHPDHMLWGQAALAALAIASAGLPTLKKGWIALRHATLNIYFLMTLAVTGALLIGKWSEAAMVIFLFAVAEAIEALSLERARKAIASLTALAPDTAWVRDDAGMWQPRPVEQVTAGSVMRVRAGERVALDGRVVHGKAALDQAPITGESLPVDKQLGDAVYAGSIVTDGVIEAEVTATAGHSTLARIASAVQEAQSQRAPTQRFVDEFARYYTPAVVILAALVALAGPWLMGGSAAHWLYQALVLLVIACPCALVVSTPVTVVSGLARAARLGILIKGGMHLEQGRRLQAMALDKTGTLTEGRPVLTDVISLGALTESEALRLAASLDQHSSHPVAQAVVAGWRQREPGSAWQAVTRFATLAGRGVQGDVAEQTWLLGNHRLVEELGCCSPELEARLLALEQQGKTVFVLVQTPMRAHTQVPSGDAMPVNALRAQAPCAQAILAVADALRPESREAIDQIKALGILPVMLTGDNQATAQHIGQQLGLADVRGTLLPEGKLDAMNTLLTQYGAVGMVGDGVNDAPALARATVGIAMGAAGTATALETADVAIMDDDPRKLGQFIRLSRATHAVLRQNIALALGIKAVFLALALGGQATLWMAVFADMGASLLVVFNGLRLLRWRP